MRCPFLPWGIAPVRASRMRALRMAGDDLYLQQLGYAQYLLSEKKPAQALLQLNKAFHHVSLSDDVLVDHPWPYAAVAWILRFGMGDGFTGNPVRHFQHYASRMSGPNSELRTWRAWACFTIAEHVLSSGDFPRDELQIKNEALSIPSINQVMQHLPADEVKLLEKLDLGELPL